MKTIEVNVAPQSTKGHFVREAVNVINIDEVKELFFVEDEHVLTSENHTTLKRDGDNLVFPQNVHNPLTGMFERSKD